jgi:hypothetical protein
VDDGLNTWYLTLPGEDKQIFLAAVSNRLTLYGRDFGIHASGEKQIRGFVGLNELQHQISQHIARIGMNSDRYSEEVIFRILEEEAQKFGLSRHLAESFKSAKSTYFPTKTAVD